VHLAVKCHRGREPPAVDAAWFDGVPEAVWNFHIPGRILTDDDIRHYHRIVIALNETIRLMNEIDEVIEAHGGWPAAFVTDADKPSNRTPAT
jgi:hypothetical protein